MFCLGLLMLGHIPLREQFDLLVPIQSLQVDIVGTAAMLLLLAAFKRPLQSAADWIERASANFVRRPVAPVLTIFFAAIILRAAVLPWVPVPFPAIDDECSYLLGADTFALGRMTNPTPASWQHFDTMHVLMKPTYQSVYMPGQALFLGFGQLIFGHPWAGVLLSTAVMCAAFFWALRGWISPGWAFLGGMMALFRVGMLSYWIDSYYGGAVAAIGGALVLGSYARLRSAFGWKMFALLGAGLVTLALTRPYEGLAFSVPVLIAIIIQAKRNRISFKRFLRHCVPLVAVLLIGATFLGFYCWRITGSPVLLPRLATSGGIPIFWFQKASPLDLSKAPAFRAEMLEWNFDQYQRTHERPQVGILSAFVVIWAFQLSIFFSVPVLLGFSKIRDWQLPLACLASNVLAIFLTSFAGNWSNVQYAAPALIATYILLMKCIQGVAQEKSDAPVAANGSRLALALVIVCACCVFFVVFRGQQTIVAGHLTLPTWGSRNMPGMDRKPAETAVASHPGKHLVIVHYAPEHSYYIDYVYNGGDLQNARIIWARTLGEEADQELIRNYPGRQRWDFYPDEPPETQPNLVLSGNN